MSTYFKPNYIALIIKSDIIIFTIIIYKIIITKYLINYVYVKCILYKTQ